MKGLRGDLLAQKVIEREVSSKIAVTDQEVNDFYRRISAQFNLTEDAYHLAQIVVTGQRDQQPGNRTGDDATTPQAATAKVQMLMERLKAGTPFADLAMDFSEDPESAPRGGDVGLVSASALKQAPPPLREAVLKLQPGSVSVVSMEGGYTVVALVAKQAAGLRDLSMPEVREGITEHAEGPARTTAAHGVPEAVRNRATVVNHLARRLVESQGKAPALTPTAPRHAVDTCAVFGPSTSRATSRRCARADRCRRSSMRTMTGCTC